MWLRKVLALVGFGLAFTPALAMADHGYRQGGVIVYSTPAPRPFYMRRHWPRHHGYLQFQMYPTYAPPAAFVENVVPRRGFVWIPGHHHWGSGCYTWTPGHWERERIGYRYAPGAWQQRDDRYYWNEGSWQPVAQYQNGYYQNGYSQNGYYQNDYQYQNGYDSQYQNGYAQPQQQNGLWIEGHWDWQNGQQVWIDGYWQQQ